jgi:hypothetical protein
MGLAESTGSGTWRAARVRERPPSDATKRRPSKNAGGARRAHVR